jgi:hypothetical protein
MTDPTEALERELEKNRLPAGVKEKILAQLPPPEEHERLYRELRNKGGLSSEEFFASLGNQVPPQPLANRAKVYRGSPRSRGRPAPGHCGG